MRKFVADIQQSLDTKRFGWILADLPYSMEIFYYATNGLKQDISSLQKYNDSWIAWQGITYIVERSEEGFMLAVNFPTILQHVMSMLKDANANSSPFITNDIIDGYYFEESFCREVQNLSVCYANQEKEEIKETCFNIALYK